MKKVHGKHIQLRQLKEYDIKSVKHNTVMNVLLTASNALVSLIAIPYVTRILSVSGYGVVGFAQNAASWFSIFATIGISTYGIRECAKARADRIALAQTLTELLALLGVFTAAALAVFAACILFIPQFAAHAVFFWIFFANTFIMSFGVDWFYQAIEQYSYITKRSVAFKVVSLAFILLFVRHADDAVQYALILAFVTCGNNLLNITKLHEYVDFRTVGRLNLKQHLKPLFSFGALNLSSSVYLTLDTVILGMFPDGDYQVGLYQLAVKLRGFLSAFVGGIANASVSRLSIYAAEKDHDDYDALLSKNLGFVTNLSFAIACYLLVFAKPLIVLVSSAKYDGSILPLQLSGFAMAVAALNTVFGFQVLTPWGKEKELAISNSIGVPVSVGLNIFLDGRFGADGAAFAYLMTESAVFVAQLVYIRKILKRIVRYSEVAKIVLCLAVSTVLSFLSLQLIGSMSAVKELTVSLVVFFVPWYVLAFMTKEDSAQMINQIFAKMLKKGAR